MTKVQFSSSLSRADIDVLSDDSMAVLINATYLSKNPEIKITSTLRPPARQAAAMYANIAAGKIIKYKAPGQAVNDICLSMIKVGKSKEETIAAMTQKIEELSENGQRVSLHCVSEAEYRKLNIVDVSFSGLPNPRDFIRALDECTSVKRVISPFSVSGASPKVSVDTNEPAIHVEISQA